MPKRNRLLAALPDETFERLKPYMELRQLKRGEVLHRPGDTIERLYFPIDCMISMTVTTVEGKTAEAAAVGSREVIGINAFMGGRETTQTEYVTQVAGKAVVLPAAPLKEEFDRNKSVRDVLLKYTQAMLAQLAQNVACNRLHHIEQRFARWLLEARDRIGEIELHLTHDFMAEILGVRRAGVTQVVGRYEAAGIIESSRGVMRILDVPRLEAASCGCHEVVMDEYERLLGPRRTRRGRAVTRKRPESGAP